MRHSLESAPTDPSNPTLAEAVTQSIQLPHKVGSLAVNTTAEQAGTPYDRPPTDGELLAFQTTPLGSALLEHAQHLETIAAMARDAAAKTGAKFGDIVASFQYNTDEKSLRDYITRNHLEQTFDLDAFTKHPAQAYRAMSRAGANLFRNHTLSYALAVRPGLSLYDEINIEVSAGENDHPTIVPATIVGANVDGDLVTKSIDVIGPGRYRFTEHVVDAKYIKAHYNATPES